MKKVSTLFVVAALLGGLFFAGPNSAQAALIELTATGDTWIRPGAPSGNYGTANGLNVLANSGPWWMQTFVQFDLSSLPSTGTIVSAKLKLYNQQIYWAKRSDISIGVYEVQGPWMENTLTYSTKPATGSAAIDSIDFIGLPDKTPPYSVSDIVYPKEWREWDVTSLVQDWYTGAKDNYGMTLRRSSTTGNAGVHVLFRSKEFSGGSLAPVLAIQHVPEPSTGLMFGLGVLVLGVAVGRKRLLRRA